MAPPLLLMIGFSELVFSQAPSNLAVQVIRGKDDMATVASKCRTPRIPTRRAAKLQSRIDLSDSIFYRAAHCAILWLEDVHGGCI